MARFGLAIRSFFGILTSGRLPDDVAKALGLVRKVAIPVAAPAPAAPAADRALQILSALQREARLIDFLMEDISGYDDQQVGAAVRSLHEQSRQSLERCVQLVPVIDGVEGSFTKLDAASQADPGAIKLVGNVPAHGKAAGGLLRHRGWRAEKVDLPPPISSRNPSILAAAEIEIE